jgi:RHS repeat-associated protein
MPYGQSLAMSYDHHMQVSGLTMTQNGSASALSYARDRDDLITQATGVGSSVLLGRSSSSGRLETVTVGNIVEVQTFDATYGEVVSIDYKYLGSPLYSVHYTRDSLLGRVVQKTEVRGGVTTATSYGYDAAGRLVSEDINGVVTTWDYDDRGNRIVLNGSTVGVVDAQDRLVSYADSSFVHDTAGNRTSRTVGGVTTTYGWDRAGNLRSALTGGVGPTYRYDGRERRVARVNAAPNRSWLYDGQLRVVGENSGTPKAFVYASRANVPDTLVTGGQTYRLVTDQLGSVQMVVNASTGAIEQSVQYDAWGNATLLSGAFMPPFGFAGGVYDASTKLLHFGAREYDPQVGRWLSKDPIRFQGGLNFYVYVNNDPVNLVDASGRFPTPYQDHGWGPFFLIDWNIAPKSHYCRNIRQKCPPTPPPCDSDDWIRDDSGAHHAMTFRGNSSGNRRYQCSYDVNGDLSNDGVRRGSYDYSAPKGFVGFFSHLLFDVAPAFVFGTGYCEELGDAYPTNAFSPTLRRRQRPGLC